MTRYPLLVLSALALAACNAEPPAHGPYDHLFQAPAGSFRHVSSTDTSGGNHDYVSIAPGDSAVILDMNGPAVVRRLWLTVASRDPHYLRRLAIKMYWDGETNPSVEAPLGDFFGDGFAKRHYTALVMGESSGGFYCYLPMPFRRHGRIVIENGTGQRVDALYYNIDVERAAPLPATVATFHAWWHRDVRTTDTLPHLILDAHGRGQFVGLSLNAESYSNNLGFLEGDEIYDVDGTRRGQGTGTEDYFNSGWYFDEGTYAGPYHGLIIKDTKRGRIAAYRWHIADPIPFDDSIRIAIEHGTNNTEVADYATMAYWYQTEPHTPLPPLPPPDARRVLGVKIPVGATPAESLTVDSFPDSLVVTAPVPRPDRYALEAYPLGGPDAGISHYASGGVTKTVALDTNEAATILPAVALGAVRGDSTVRITVTGSLRRPGALYARPVRRWATEWNVVGPFPSPPIAGTDHSSALDTVHGPERDPALDAAYVGLNGARVRWRRATADSVGRVHLLSLFTPTDWVSAYAETFLYSPVARRVTLLLGADDAHVLWLNGTRESERQGRHNSEPDDVAVPVQLTRGWNRVLLEVANLDGGWAFMLRAADPAGDLRWSPNGR